MQALFILAIIWAVFAIIGIIVRAFVPKNSPDRPVALGFALTFLALAGVFTFFSSLTGVSTKNVGIITSFGRTSGDLSNGLHFVAPWDQVTEMNAAIQTDSYTRDSCISVRIANQQTACVDVSIRWRIKPSSADELFQNFRDFTNVRDSLVTRELTAALNYQLTSYNPLNSIGGGASTNPSLASVASSVTTQMRREIGSDIEVLNTIIPIITFDPQTQSRINQLQQQIALTRIAEQEVLTNEAQAKANAALATSVNRSPNVLVAECLTILSNMVKNGQTVPAGFSCWPGGGVAAVIAGPTSSTPASTSGK